VKDLKGHQTYNESKKRHNPAIAKQPNSMINK